MARKPTTAVANAPRGGVSKQQAGAVSTAVPEFMRGDAGRGTENMSQADLETPRLKLLQGISPELEQYREARAGMFLHTASEQLFETVNTVILWMDRRFILWNPRESGGGILARADDGIHWRPADRLFDVKLDKKDGGHKVQWKTAKTVEQSGLGEWGTMNPKDPDSGPAATLMYNYAIAFPDFPELMPAVVTLQRGAVRVARKFNSKLKTLRCPTFGAIYQLGSDSTTNNVGQGFYIPQFTGIGYVNDQDQYADFETLHEQFKSTGLNIRDLESAQEEMPGGEERGGSKEEVQAPSRGGAKAGTGRRPNY